MCSVQSEQIWHGDVFLFLLFNTNGIVSVVWSTYLLNKEFVGLLMSIILIKMKNLVHTCDG